jgi:competence protein ComEA
VAPADPASVNLAAVVADGQQIAVGVPGAAPAPGAATPASGAAGSGPVDLNAATVGVLDALPGIGPVLAQRIVDFRTQHGRFTSVDELDDVPGIGPALYARLAAQVRV